MKLKLLLLFTFVLIAANMVAQSKNQMMNIDDLSKHSIKHTEVNNLDYYYIEKGEGETIFLLHGFPDMANTWDESIDELSKKYRCIAPFLRGYYPTSIPSDGNYSSKAIADDIRKLAEKLDIERYYVIGQDWGASVAYSMFNLCPENIIKGITVAIPHPTAIKPTPLLLYKARHFLKLSNPKKAVPLIKKNNYSYIDMLFERWSPDWKDYKATSDGIKKTFEMEGRIEAALGYYWTFNEKRKDKALNSFYAQIPTIPVLAIAGKRDGALVLKQFKKMKKKMNDDFQLVIHNDVGHFLHREDNPFFVSHVLKFFKE